MGLRNLKLEA